MKLVVLEDWNHFFPGVPSLEALRARAEVEIQHDSPANQDDLVARNGRQPHEDRGRHPVAPTGRTVVANGSLVSKTPTTVRGMAMTETRWREARPIASYLMVIAAGTLAEVPIQVQTNGQYSVTLSSIVCRARS